LAIAVAAATAAVEGAGLTRFAVVAKGVRTTRTAVACTVQARLVAVAHVVSTPWLNHTDPLVTHVLFGAHTASAAATIRTALLRRTRVAAIVWAIAFVLAVLRLASALATAEVVAIRRTRKARLSVVARTVPTPRLALPAVAVVQLTTDTATLPTTIVTAFPSVASRELAFPTFAGFTANGAGAVCWTYTAVFAVHRLAHIVSTALAAVVGTRQTGLLIVAFGIGAARTAVRGAVVAVLLVRGVALVIAAALAAVAGTTLAVLPQAGVAIAVIAKRLVDALAVIALVVLLAIAARAAATI